MGVAAVVVVIVVVVIVEGVVVVLFEGVSVVMVVPFEGVSVVVPFEGFSVVVIISSESSLSLSQVSDASGSQDTTQGVPSAAPDTLQKLLAGQVIRAVPSTAPFEQYPNEVREVQAKTCVPEH